MPRPKGSETNYISLKLQLVLQMCMHAEPRTQASQSRPKNAGDDPLKRQLKLSRRADKTRTAYWCELAC